MKKKIENGVINIKRLVIDVPEDLLFDIKGRAVFRHQSIKKWVLDAIAVKMAQEDRFK